MKGEAFALLDALVEREVEKELLVVEEVAVVELGTGLEPAARELAAQAVVS